MLATRRWSESTLPRFISVRASSRRCSGRSGKSWASRSTEGKLAQQVALGVGQAAGILFDQAQAVARLGERLAKTRRGGKLGDQGVEQLEGVAIVLLGLLEITQLAMDPAAKVESQRQVVADLAVTWGRPRGPFRGWRSPGRTRTLACLSWPFSLSRSAWLFRV